MLNLLTWTTKGDLAAQEILTDLQADNQEFDDPLLKNVLNFTNRWWLNFRISWRNCGVVTKSLTKQHYHFTEKKLGQKIDQLQAN